MTTTSTTWSGRRVTQARAMVARTLPHPCGRCGKPVTAKQRWVVGHIKGRATHPHLIWEPSNWQPEHRACSDATGQQGVIEKARADVLREIGLSSHDETPGQPPPLPFSPSGHQIEPVKIRDSLKWTNTDHRAPAWMAGLRRVPRDAAAPLAMTPPHPQATGSYGPAAARWIESEFRIRLRWWQRLCLVRILEHREDGSLCWPTVVFSASRRSGKSVLLRGLAAWRLHNRDMFGEPQLIAHTGSDVNACREVQRGAWGWAEAQGWMVGKSNGKERVETHLGDRWLVQSQDAAGYSYDVTLSLVDESWDVKPSTVDDGLEPAMLERVWAQMLITSTAHRRATSLMRKRISDALAADDGSTLLILWAAEAGDDPGEVSTWRKASPHWSTDREKRIRAKYEKALRGEADPELDDPDPMAGFVSQYLNVWRLKERREVGQAVITEDDWEALTTEAPFAPPDAAAIESWFADGVSVALAWKAAPHAIVSVTDHPDLASAATFLKESGFKGTATVGSSLLKDPALAGIRKKAGEGRTGPSVQEMTRLLAEDVVRHDGGSHLTEQLLAVRTKPGADGPRMASQGRADAVKAAVWALGKARPSGRGKVRLLMPSSA